jgi:formylmethanofuran dehydrogenase subunit C
VNCDTPGADTAGHHAITFNAHGEFQMVKVTTQTGTVTMVSMGSVVVEIDATLDEVMMLTSDFVSFPRVGQRVTLTQPEIAKWSK